MGRPVRGWVGRLLAVGRCIQDAAALAPGRVGHPLEVGRCTRGAFCSRLGAVEREPAPTPTDSPTPAHGTEPPPQARDIDHPPMSAC